MTVEPFGLELWRYNREARTLGAYDIKAGQKHSFSTRPSDASAPRSVKWCHFWRDFVHVLQQLRELSGFLLIGWVLIPEHFHLLLQPQPTESSGLRMDRID